MIVRVMGLDKIPQTHVEPDAPLDVIQAVRTGFGYNIPDFALWDVVWREAPLFPKGGYHVARRRRKPTVQAS